MADPERTAAWKLAAALARSTTEGEVAAAVARAAALLAGAESVRVWMIDHSRGYRFAGAWPLEPKPPQAPPDDVARALAFAAPVAGPAGAPFRSRLVVPLLAGPRALGAVELLERQRASGPFTTADADGSAPLLEAADAVLASVRDRAVREERHVGAVARLTRLFDVGRTFASTLDEDELKELIVNRVQAALEVEGAYLWLMDEASRSLSVAAAAGPAAEAVRRWEIEAGDGPAGQAAESGLAVAMDDPDEIAEQEGRPDVQAGFEIRGVVAVPMPGPDEKVLGVIEVLNKRDDSDFENDDVAVLNEIAASAAGAIANARRLDAERRASDLGTLLEASRQLGSSLDVKKITFTLVHQAASVIKYRRASAGLLRGARLELSAVSGQAFVDETLPETKALRDLLEWVAGLDEGIYVVQEDDGSIDTARPETREKFRAYFESAGTRSFLGVPLGDDEGRLGAFAVESAEPYAFQGRDLEAAGLLAVQATGALRNAILFQQIPALRLFGPLAGRQRWFMGLSWGRRAAWSAGAVALIALPVLVEVPLRVSGEARVLPAARLPVTAEADGRVRDVLVREGDRVEPGQVVAVLDDTENRIGAEEARTRYEVALKEQGRLRAGGLTADAAAEGARVQGLRAEVDLWERRLAGAEIRATAAGIVATPRVEELVGTGLRRGDVFCEVVDPARQRIEVQIPEEDAGLVAPGMPVKVKLGAYPETSFRARVERVGVAAAETEGGRVFLARAALEGKAPPLRTGMSGRAKVAVGPASLARVVLRRPARWLWGLVWGWLP